MLTVDVSVDVPVLVTVVMVLVGVDVTVDVAVLVTVVMVLVGVDVTVDVTVADNVDVAVVVWVVLHRPHMTGHLFLVIRTTTWYSARSSVHVDSE